MACERTAGSKLLREKVRTECASYKNAPPRTTRRSLPEA
jgi:hypothetical protein